MAENEGVNFISMMSEMFVLHKYEKDFLLYHHRDIDYYDYIN